MDKVTIMYLVMALVMALVLFVSGLLSGIVLERLKKKNKQRNYTGTLYIHETASFKNYNLNIDSFEDLDKADFVTFRVERHKQSI